MNLQKLLLTRRFFSTLAFFSMQTVFFIYLQGKGLSNSEIAFSLSLLFFCNQALAILAGIWGDRFGPVSYTHNRAHETLRGIAYAVVCL